MQLTQFLAVVPFFTTALTTPTLAVPADLAPIDKNPSPGTNREIAFAVHTFSGLNCTGKNATIPVSQSSACWPITYSNVKSIVHCNTCAVVTWSGTNCKGSSQVIPLDCECHNVEYASVHVDCHN
ncbi:hypothetical protein OQA88_1176 [Cercophora sp. LCS_1]